MFRRKEETANDPANPAAAAALTGSHPGGMQADGSSAPSAPSSSSSSASGNSASSSQPTASAGNSAQATASYAPTAPTSPTASAAASASRPAEPARSATPPATSNYRPTPIAEFNRGASRTNEPHRAPPATGAASSFGSTTDKTGVKSSNRRVLTVGNDILLKGEIATCDRLVIEGRVEAKLSEVHTVEIAECGSFKGTAEVEDAEISGVFEGDLIVRNRLVIYSSGEVRGNITYGEIEIERGGRLTGQIKTGSQSAKGKAFDAQQDKRPTKEAAA